MVLKDIAEDQSRISSNPVSQDRGFEVSPTRISPNGAPRKDMFQNQNTRRFPGGITLPSMHDAPLLSAMSPDESHEFMSTGKLPGRLQYQHEEEMEWDPAPSQVLTMARSPQVPPLFARPESLSSVANPSPFWFKVPPAPVGPAHRLRNPPNQPRFQPRTEEAKQNFFDTMKGASYGSRLQYGTSDSDKPRRHEMDIAQQKFFPPTNTADNVLNGLSEMLGTVNLKGESEIGASSDARGVTEGFTTTTLRRIFTLIILTCSFFGWGYAYLNHSPHMWNVNLTVTVICGGIAVRSFLDHTITAWMKGNARSKDVVCATVSGFEAAAAGHGIFDALVNQSQSDSYHSQFVLPLGCVMLVHELWLAIF